MAEVLSIDLETYSDADLVKCGVYAYADSPDFEILLMAYSIDDEDTKVIDLAGGECIPEEIKEYIFDTDVIKTAFNANFERICLSRHFKKYIPPHSWVCSAVMSAMLSLPPSLDEAGKLLGLKQKKMKEGKELIRYFSIPCSPSKINGGRTRNLSSHNIEKWNLFKSYCIRDVDVEKSIRNKLEKLFVNRESLCGNGGKIITCSEMEASRAEKKSPLCGEIKMSSAEKRFSVCGEIKMSRAEKKSPVCGERQMSCEEKRFSACWEKEEKLYNLDQKINDRGILVDMEFVNKAIEIERCHKEIMRKKACEISGLVNPNSVSQLKAWLRKRGLEIESLSKKDTEKLMKNAQGKDLEMLKLRLLMSKTSVRKYEAVKRAVCSDGRVHGLLQFYGASRSGRWAGRLVQVQNLPQNHMKDLDLARNMVKYGTLEELELLYESTPKVLSELIRTSFISEKGCRFIVADFSAIEARVLSYLACEKWRLNVFRTHGKIYEASAGAMFHVPLEEIKKGSPLRQKGKIAELALGYGGSVGALTAMGALDMGLEEKELKALVTSWRRSNPFITKFWWDVDKAAVTAVKNKCETQAGPIKFACSKGILFVTLPSGRKLSYISPILTVNRFGNEGLSYEGIGENKKWTRIDTYGPKLVENIVQAVARDILAEAMLRLDKAGFNIVIHVHDEVVIEAPAGTGSVREVCEIMTRVPHWAEGLPLNADGYECDYYKKD